MTSPTVPIQTQTDSYAQHAETSVSAKSEITSPYSAILALLDDPCWPTESDKAIAAYELSRARVARQTTLTLGGKP